MMKLCRWATAGLLPIVFVLAGCGGSSTPEDDELVPVSGTVKLRGEPTEGILVTFTPADSTIRLGSFATTDDAGNYVLEYGSKGEPGVPAGRFVVTFSKLAMGDGSQVSGEGDENSEGRKERRRAKNLVPPAWNMPDKAGPHNMVTVPAGGATLDFDLVDEPASGGAGSQPGSKDKNRRR